MLSQAAGTTLFMTLMAAFQSLMYLYTGQEEVVVSTGVANRDRRETEPLIGCLINILLLRTSFSGNPTFREILGECARRRWAPSPTRTSPSSNWSRSCSRSAT